MIYIGNSKSEDLERKIKQKCKRGELDTHQIIVHTSSKKNNDLFYSKSKMFHLAISHSYVQIYIYI